MPGPGANRRVTGGKQAWLVGGFLAVATGSFLGLYLLVELFRRL